MKKRSRLLLGLLVLVIGLYVERRHDYFDFKGTFYMTLDDDSTAIIGPSGVAVYCAEPVVGAIRDLVLHRATLHRDGQAMYSDGLFLNLADPRDQTASGPFRWVMARNGQKLCEINNEKTGGYALTGLHFVPDTLLALPVESGDTIEFQLLRRLRAYPSSPPPIPGWHEQWLIMTHDRPQRKTRTGPTAFTPPPPPSSPAVSRPRNAPRGRSASSCACSRGWP